MGWPRKDDMRLYREKDGGYFLLLTCNGTSGGSYDALVNVHKGPKPSLASSSVSRYYLGKARPTRVEWTELPKAYQTEFCRWFGEDFNPKETRGLWKIS